MTGFPIEHGRGWSTVVIEDLCLDMKIGVADVEKHPDYRQRLLVSVEMFFHQDRHEGETIDAAVDYNRVASWLKSTWPRKAHTELLEPLAEELVNFVFEDARIEAVKVSLRKPDIYQDARAVGITFMRLRANR